MFIPTFDPIYILFVMPAFFLGIIASIALHFITRKYESEALKQGFTGLDVAKMIGEHSNLRFRVELIEKTLGESYDPRSKTVSISHSLAHSTSITSAAIIAHELGHAEQHQKASALFSFRNMIIPAVNIGTNIGYFLLILGLVIQLSELAWLGIILFSLATFFAFITVPLELDASRRALNLLNGAKVIYPPEQSGVKLVLGAAALTYVAGLFQSLGQLLYFLLRVQGLSRKD